MSQWNNSYNYNNQYQPPNNWNSEYNNQYVNQPYYPDRQYNPNNQYVGFDEFVSQMHISNVPQSNVPNFSNVQYQNYPNSQYSNIPNYQNGSMGNNSQEEYLYGSNTANFSSNDESYQTNTQNQYNPVTSDQNNLTNEMVSKSKLTATATEFVPKNSKDKPDNNTETAHGSSSSSTALSESSKNLPKPSTSSNWRERPPNSNQGASQIERNLFQKPRVQETNSRNKEIKYESKRNQDLHNSQNESASYHSKKNKDSSSRPSDPSARSRKIKNHSTDTSLEVNHHSQVHSESSNSLRSNRDNDSCAYNHEGRNYQSDSNSMHETNNHQGGQSKYSRAKNRESDVGRTFYNSGMPKDSQDVRNGRDGSAKSRKWAGSQRVRSVEKNYVEDEQYASSYLQYKEERTKDNVTSSPRKSKNKSLLNITANTDMTQRERLSEQLDKGTLECLVCCERVKQIDPVWYCSNCYHVFHLRCTRKWAMSSMVESKWRCPACQNTNLDIPIDYRCMCGAVRNPEYQRGSSGAHTCGKSCKRLRTCPHPCTLLCHPGPCPPCQATISKQCGCGAETRSVLCSSKLPQVCGRECHRQLECGVHFCTKECHEGPCGPCGESVTQACHCPAALTRSVACTSCTGGDRWSCGAACGRVLACGAHVCRARCHPPPCAACPLRPDAVPACPCGKTRILKDQRKSCTDPIPLCGNICAKPLSCGPSGDKHFCREICHEGECRMCPDNTLLQCRCGHSSREVPCVDLPQMYNNVLCQRKCNKKLSCGRHRCRTVCCAAATHRCPATCGRSLSCQTHRCEEFCHTGHCAPCPVVSFEELPCECGAEVLLPPVRCGTKPPACSAPCRRRRACAHPPHHSCHAGACPPCVVLTTKRCYGDHEERKTIPCSQEEFSCGLPCGKPLPCGKHTCIKTCHKGACDTGKCTQPCNEKRPSCGHPCAAPCHSGRGAGGGGVAGAAGGSPCPSAAPCRRSVHATCPCARRKAERTCSDNSRDYAKMMSTLAASKMQEGGTVDLSDPQRPGNMLKTLECDEECLVEARSRRLALALQIRNPDVSAKLAPRYSEHVRATAARDPAFAQLVHGRLADLVQLAKKSKQKTRAHSFPSMNRQKRQFIHELCEHFGCESVAYDAEPNRNVVATADKEKSWLPAMSVLEVLAREAGKRRVPGPVLRAPAHPAASKSTGGWATLTSTNAWAARSQASKLEPKIDYFDNPPDN